MSGQQQADQPKRVRATEAEMVKWFRNSAPYINAHRGKTMVILVPGEAVADGNFVNVIHDIALLNSLGVRLVLAVGARPQIAAQLAAEGFDSELHQGLRVTRLEELTAVKRAMGCVRADVEALFSTGLINSPMHGASIRVVSGNFVSAKPIGVRDGIDFCYTGEVRKLALAAITRALDDGAMVMLPSLGYSPSGEVFNLSVEDVATQAAIALGADKLIVLSDALGARNEQGELLREIQAGDCARLLNRDDLSFSLRQALRACYNTVDASNCGSYLRAHIISYQQDGALLAELFTRDGAGTLITQSSFEKIRRAGIDDVSGILELIQPLEQQGVLVRRSRELLETEIERFTVIERDGMVIACAALYVFPDEHSAEIACVVVHPDYRGNQRASALLQYLEQEAHKLALETVFVLTTQTAHWFVEKGFVQGELDALPVAKQQLYNYQRNAKIFLKSLKA